MTRSLAIFGVLALLCAALSGCHYHGYCNDGYHGYGNRWDSGYHHHGGYYRSGYHRYHRDYCD